MEKEMHGFWLICCLMLAVASVDLRASQDLRVPDLPNLTLDNFSPLIRDQIQKAYADARAHARDDFFRFVEVARAESVIGEGQ